MRVIPVLPVLLAAIVFSTGAGFGQESTDRVADELAGIRQTLDRVVRLLEAAEVRHEADLLLRRIELMERRIAPLQGQVNNAQAEVHGLETEIRRMDQWVEELESAIDDAIREGTDQPDSPSRNELGHVRGELKRLTAQLEIAELRKRQAEDALADARDDIEVLDDSLLELLDGRRRPR